MSSTREQVELLLAAAGLKVSDERELAALVEGYLAQRAGIETLYELPRGRYEDHGLIFQAAPPLLDWRESEGVGRRPGGVGREPQDAGRDLQDAGPDVSQA
ncbi:MAG TPA: hypothetical protein VHW67_04940 [Solirubrobacteraceae bacterium]|jgi:hypothetical protein|nr:hypothetical protein [Solirubrobacteraceae bacterium]